MADGQIVASAFLQGVYHKAAEAADGSAGSRDLRRVLKALSRVLPALEGAEQKQWDDIQAREWLRRLKQAAYDLDDLIDSMPSETAGPSGRQWTASRCFFVLLHALSRPSIRVPLKELNAIRSRIEGLEEGGKLRGVVSAAADYSCFTGGSARHSMASILRMEDQSGGEFNSCPLGGIIACKEGKNPDLISSPLGPQAGLVAMEDDSDRLLKILITEEESSTEDANLAVVSISGQGGVGKTTLARKTFNDKRIVARFDLRLWIDAYDIYDTSELFRSMLHKIQENNAYIPGELEEKVVESLFEKRFFLVLDDPWHEKIKWWTVRKYLEVGAKGSKVIIVTDDAKMAKALGDATAFHVRGLLDDHCWELLQRYAFDNAEASPRFEAIGKKITSRLKGLPLSVKMMGSLLRPYPNPQFWEMVDKHKVWSLPPDALQGIPPAIWLSYHYLPPVIKQCLSYCSTFSKHHEYERDSMAQMWVAQGLIRSSNGVLIEDKGNDAFDFLVNRSFLQSLEGANKYVMDSDVHQLVVALSQDETLQLGVGNDASIMTPTKVRHLLIFSDHLKEDFVFEPARLESVRTLVFYGLTRRRFDFNTFLSKLKLLRVLCLNAPLIQELHYPIMGMKFLRYLDLRFTAVRRFPEEACDNLASLQTLKFHKDALLPRGLWKLSNLRHLEADNDKKSQIFQVGKLALLQELKNVVVSKEPGHSIEELKGMNQLRGELLVLGLEYVKSGEEAMLANLSSKAHLRKLELEWSPLANFFDPRPNWDAILEGLRPHQLLEQLTIRNHPGSIFPQWLGNQWLSKLQNVEIYDCHHWKLPPLGQLPFLRSLVVEFGYRSPLDSRGHMPNVLRSGPEFYGNGPVSFPVLEHLRITGIKEWEEWAAVEDGKLFPKLLTLVIDNCINMKELPSLPRTIEELTLKKAGLIELPRVQGSKPGSFLTLSLSTLYISCPSLSSLEEIMKHDLKNLKSLTITQCESLTSLPENGFSALNSLETLEISFCPKLASSTEPVFPSSLSNLSICGCPSLTNESFFVSLKNLSSLTTLNIGEASTRYLPGELLRHLSNLTNMKIENCEALLNLGLMAMGSLKRLEISSCPNLLSTSSPYDRAWLPLESLRIKGCSLHILTAELLRRLSNLQELTIDDCFMDAFLDEVEMELQNLASLHRLAVTRCFELLSLPWGLGNIPRLEELCIVACPKVKALPEKHLPATLAMFSLDDCPELVERCKEKGEDWHKIEHATMKYLNFTKKDGLAISSGSFVNIDRKWIPGMKGEEASS